MKKNGNRYSRIMLKERELILKVIYGQTKFNESIKFTQQVPVKFFTLKAKIYEELKQLNEIKKEQLLQMQIADKDGFLFLENDNIESFLKNNDIINVKFNSQQNNKNQANSLIKEQEQPQSQFLNSIMFESQIQQTQLQISQQAEKPEIIMNTMEQQEKNNSASTKRIMKEMNSLINSPLDKVKIFPSKENSSYWKVLLIGPENTSYNQGVYLISILFPSDYPFKPPKIQFLTKIYHCNVSQQGSICLDILRDQWSPAFTISNVLVSILDLLQNPNQDQAIESSIVSLMRHEPEQFKQKLIEETLKFANQDAKKLVQLILGGDLNQMSDEFSNLKEEIEKWIADNKNQEKFQLLVI